MSRLFKGLAVLVAVTSFTWVAVLWHWQSTQRDMSAEDVGLYLVLLPLTLFVLVLLGRWAWRGAAASAASRDSGASPAAAPPAVATPGVDEAQRQVTVQLLAAWLRCAAGANAAEVLDAAAEGQPRPALDPELRDDDGLPLMTARVPQLDVDELDLDAKQLARPEARRALALLAATLEALPSALAPWASRFGAADSSAGPAVAAEDETSTLRVLALWPAGFDAEERAQAEAWLVARLRATGVVAPQRLAVLPAPAGAPWPEVERLLHLLHREGRHDVVLVTACHSALGELTLRRLQAADQLFTSRSLTRPIAGEGAAALLLAPLAFPPAPDATAAPVQLHRGAVAQRDKPVDAPGRSSAQAARSCLQQALDCTGFERDQVAGAVHDADLHTPRAAESMTALLAELPHLQPSDDVCQTGALTGQLGPVAPLLAIALAAQRVTRLGKPCLALSVDDAQWRLALVARPESLEPDAALSGASPAIPTT